MTIQEILKEFKTKSGYTNEYIAEQIGVTRFTLARLISGETKKVSEDVVKRLTALLGVDVEQIMKDSLFKFEKPILGIAKAGYGLFAEENYLGYEEVSDRDNKQGDYFLKVTGNSMDGAKIHDGDLVFVKQCNDINSGEIGVILISGVEVTIKRVVKKTNMLILEAANPAVENRYFTPKEVNELPVKIIGKVLYSKTIFE
jgi:repressor LexA